MYRNSTQGVVKYPLEQPPSPEKVRETVVFMGTGVAFAFAPEVIAVAPESYVWSAILSEAGYIGGSVFTRQEIDPVDMVLAFYVGGLSPEHFGIHPVTLAGKAGVGALWGGANNLTQYGISSVAHRNPPTGDEIYWNFVSGGLAGGAGTIGEAGFEALARREVMSPGFRATLGGAAKVVSPVSDASAQLATHYLDTRTSTEGQSLTVGLYTAHPASLGSSSGLGQSSDVFPWYR